MSETLPGDSLSAGIAAIALAVGLSVLAARRNALRQTTLTSAWWWTVLALIAWSAVELAAHAPASSLPMRVLAPLRFAAIALSTCPVVSLIGAKRPQHAAWNFVVLALWGIVALPAGEALALGRSLELGAGRSSFLAVLIALGPINLLPTRYWASSLLVTAGQTLALWPYLPLTSQRLFEGAELAGLVGCSAGLLLGWLIARRATAATSNYDRLWRDFRDSFGLFWALRVQERVNAAARQYGWDLALAWSGFVRASDGAALAAIDPAIERTLRITVTGLLRRFVSRAWIAERLETAKEHTAGMDAIL